MSVVQGSGLGGSSTYSALFTVQLTEMVYVLLQVPYRQCSMSIGLYFQIRFGTHMLQAKEYSKVQSTVNIVNITKNVYSNV